MVTAGWWRYCSIMGAVLTVFDDHTRSPESPLDVAGSRHKRLCESRRRRTKIGGEARLSTVSRVKSG
ncbi:hypothetical protein SLA2020_504300 [Shorea laevis]